MHAQPRSDTFSREHCLEQLIAKVAPFRALHDLWWRRLIAARTTVAWLECAEQLSYSMRASVPLLRTCHEAALKRNGCDDLAEWAAKHIPEEQHHHEWILEDLIEAGLPREKLGQAIPDERVLQLVGNQFALIVMVHPAALLGYVLVMECQPHDRERMRSDAAALGIPQASLRTMIHHSDVDVDHRAEIFRLIEKHVRDPQCFSAMLTAASQTLVGWAAFFQARIDANA